MKIMKKKQIKARSLCINSTHFEIFQHSVVFNKERHSKSMVACMQYALWTVASSQIQIEMKVKAQAKYNC